MEKASGEKQTSKLKFKNEGEECLANELECDFTQCENKQNIQLLKGTKLIQIIQSFLVRTFVQYISDKRFILIVFILSTFEFVMC